MLQSALLLSQLVVFKSEISFAIARSIGNLDDITEIRSKLQCGIHNFILIIVAAKVKIPTER